MEGPVRVRLLAEHLKKSYGPYMHVAASKVDRGVARGLWVREGATEGRVYETREMVAEESSNYLTRTSFALSHKNLWGKKQ